MDGGVSHFSGNYFVGIKGTWVHGMKAVRFFCFALALPQPPKRHFEEAVPTEDQLWNEHLKDGLRDESYETLSKMGFFNDPSNGEN